MKTFHANIFRAALLLTAGVVLTIPARANVLTLDWISPGNNPVGGYYVSPYTAEIENTGNFITLYCIDFNHEIAPPDQWNATIQPLDLANVPSMQYGNSSSNVNSVWVNYEAAAWLITQLTNTSDPYQQGVDQYAAWQIFLDPAHSGNYNGWLANLGTTFTNQVDEAYNDAFAAVQNGYHPVGWDVVTPDPAGEPDSAQEFLTPGTGGFAPITTPEPVSIVLMGSALLGVAIVARKRSNRKRAEIQ